MVRGKSRGIPLGGVVIGLGFLTLLAYTIHKSIQRKVEDPVNISINGEVVVDAMERMAQNPVLVVNNRENLINYVEGARGMELATMTKGTSSQVQLEGRTFAFAKHTMEDLDIPVKPVITPGEVFGARASKMATAYSLGI